MNTSLVIYALIEENTLTKETMLKCLNVYGKITVSGEQSKSYKKND